MFYTVSYDVFACDDGVAETVTRHFDDFVDAVGYWAECSEAENNCVISLASLNDEPNELPFWTQLERLSALLMFSVL